MKRNKIVDLPEDYALVLQQVKDSGEENFSNLSETLHLNQSRLTHIIQALQQKGLISVSQSVYNDVWIRLSIKGSKLIAYIWPEAMHHT